MLEPDLYSCAMTAADRDPDRLADFGYERVPWGEKKARVRGVFDSVASRYDLMNDAMSGGLHRLWKRFTLAKTGLRPGQQALDVAAGSGDLAVGLARRVGASGRVVVTDINARDARRRAHAPAERRRSRATSTTCWPMRSRCRSRRRASTA